jgi:hypothetical protein
LINLRDDLDQIRDVSVIDGATSSSLEAGNSFIVRRDIQKTSNITRARISIEETVRADADSAQATLITTAQATADDATATSLFKMESVVAPTGVDVRLSLSGRATLGDIYKEVGLLLDINLDSGSSGVDGTTSILMKADKTFIVDSSDVIVAMFSSDAIILAARIPSITVGMLAADSVNASKIVAGSITTTEIAAATIAADRMATGVLLTEQILIDGGLVSSYVTNSGVYDITVDVTDYDFITVKFVGQTASGGCTSATAVLWYGYYSSGDALTRQSLTTGGVQYLNMEWTMETIGTSMSFSIRAICDVGGAPRTISDYNYIVERWKR